MKRDAPLHGVRLEVRHDRSSQSSTRPMTANVATGEPTCSVQQGQRVGVAQS